MTAKAAATMYSWPGGYKSGGNAFDGFPQAWQRQMLARARSALRETDQMMRPYPSRAMIRSISCPVSVIEGELSDPTFPRVDAFVMRLLPQARKISLACAAHFLQIDQPERWVEAVIGTTTRQTMSSAATADTAPGHGGRIAPGSESTSEVSQ